MTSRYLCFALTALLLLSSTAIAEAEPGTVRSYYGNYDASQKKSGFPAESLEAPVAVEWVSPVPARSYHLGVLLPNLKDSYWTAANYGLISHAKKLGVRITLHTVDGYMAFGDQRQQLYDLAQKTKVDGIILASVDYTKMDRFVEEVSRDGVPVIALINDIHAPAIKAKAAVSYYDAGYKTGQFVLKDSPNQNIRVAFFPGPEKSGWAEDMYQGFIAAVSDRPKDGRSVTVAAPLYGDTRPKVQKNRLLFYFANKENRATDYIVGNAVAAVEAVKYLQANNKINPNTKIVSTYMTAPLYDLIKKGAIEAAPYDQPLLLSRLALDMMIRILNGEKAGKDFPFRASPPYIMLTEDNITQYSYEELFGPRNYQPIVNLTD